MSKPHHIRILGVHLYLPTSEVYEDTVAALYGTDFDSADRAQIESDVDEHFEHLHLIEIEVEPSGDQLEWREITQRVAQLDRSSWQAPYDEQALDARHRRWVFFFHFLDATKPLQTPCGPLRLPPVTPVPRHLKQIVYQAP